jgi:hypothetical protein
MAAVMIVALIGGYIFSDNCAIAKGKADMIVKVSKNTMAQAAKLLKSNPRLTVTVVAYRPEWDPRSGAVFKASTSEVMRVKDLLVGKGIEPPRVRVGFANCGEKVFGNNPPTKEGLYLWIR